MKGIVFTEFLEMVDSFFSPEITEEIIYKSDLPSGGAYTSIGTYDHAEIVALVTNLSNITDTPIPDLIQTFGTHLLSRFAILYPNFFEDIENVKSFLERVDGYIHVEVKKLYPDADLPKLETERIEGDDLVLTYRSDRHMGDLAEGLIKGAIGHFGGQERLTRDDINEPGDAQCVRFKILT